MKNHRLRRLKKQITQIILPVACYLLLVTNCSADGSVSSDELIQNAKEYDGKEVVFQGEVIGDIMKRGNITWINIFDGKNALGVFLDNTVSHNILVAGDYNHKGDIVEVNGIFHKACIAHGGDLDIHASKMIKLKDGYIVVHSIDQKKIRIVLWLVPILFGLIIITKISRSKERGVNK